MSGGSGYVLSREAVRRFVEEALPDKKKCRVDNTGAEDLEMGKLNRLEFIVTNSTLICVYTGKCLENVNVIAGDSRDNKKGRFFIFEPSSHLFPQTWKPDGWYPMYAYYPLHDVSLEIILK